MSSSFPIIYCVWWIKFLLKIFLLSFNVPYVVFSRLGLFKHGEMHSNIYANKIWDLHFLINDKIYDIDKTGSFLELGPGDSLKSGLKAVSVGFNNYYFIDNNNYANDYLSVFQNINNTKNNNKIHSGKEKNYCFYFTNAEKSFSNLSNDSLSFVFSNSVLQHIASNKVSYVLSELNRASSPNCIQSHVIDLRDMINRSKIHLSIPNFIWESKFLKSKSIYTNRFSFTKWKDLFINANFNIIDISVYDHEDNLLLNNESYLDPVSVCSMHIIVTKNS